jgi:hypothetical protein
MQSQALYVVTDMGRERFIWATSAAEARALASAARTAETARTAHRQTRGRNAAPLQLPERRVQHEVVAER